MREGILKDGIQMSGAGGWERMKRWKEGEGVSLSETVKGQDRKEGSSGALPAQGPGQRRGRDKGEEDMLKGSQMWPTCCGLLLWHGRRGGRTCSRARKD